MRLSFSLSFLKVFFFPYLYEISLAFEKWKNGIENFGEEMVVCRFAGELVERLDQSGVIGWTSTEENLAFTEKPLDAQMVRVRQ